jgi:hypothetical protein
MNARSTALVLSLALAACSHEGENLSGEKKAAPPGATTGATAPAADPQKAMGGDPHAGVGKPAPDPHGGIGKVVPRAAGPSPLAWTAPSGWKESKPSSGMRLAQFDVGTDDAGDPVQCILFGGSMGTDDENIARWVGQMGPTAKDSAVVTKSEAGGVKTTRLVARGTYVDSMRPGEPKAAPEATMLAAIVEAPGGKLYVKLAGPKAVVDAAEKQFDEFLASLKPK